MFQLTGWFGYVRGQDSSGSLNGLINGVGSFSWQVGLGCSSGLCFEQLQLTGWFGVFLYTGWFGMFQTDCVVWYWLFIRTKWFGYFIGLEDFGCSFYCVEWMILGVQ